MDGLDDDEDEEEIVESRDTSPPEQQDDCEQQMPRYDCDERALYVGTEKIKVFRSPAENQERILWAFQEANWAIKIDDPLPGDPNIVPKKRLKDTLRALNQGLDKKDIIRFVGDGTGEGVKWEWG